MTPGGLERIIQSGQSPKGTKYPTTVFAIHGQLAQPYCGLTELRVTATGLTLDSILMEAKVAQVDGRKGSSYIQNFYSEGFMQFDMVVTNVDGSKETVRCTQTARAFTMGASYMHEPDVCAVSASPDTKELQVKYQDGTKTSYNRSTDPKYIALSIDWGLNGCNPVQDTYLDGVGISDWSYYKRQRNSLFGALMRKLKALGMDESSATALAAKGTAEYTALVFVQKGVNLNKPIPKDMMENDLRYDDLRRERAIRA